MKNFIFKLFGFGFFCFVLYAFSIYLWNQIRPADLKTNLNYRPAHGGHFFTRLREAESYSRNVDVLVVGSSHAYRSFDPRIFAKANIKLFNLGSSAQTPIQSEILLTKYFNKFNPKLVIMEIYPGSLASDGVESALDLISNTPSNDSLTFKMVYSLNNLKLWNTYFLVKMNDLLKLYNIDHEPIVKGRDRYIQGGFVENMSINSINCQTKLEFEKINPEQVASIRRMENYLKDRNVKLVFVSAPVTKSYFQSYTNYQAHLNAFTLKSNYYNFSQFKGLDDVQHFIDCDHLNQYGVEIFNEEILKLPDFKLKG